MNLTRYIKLAKEKDQPKSIPLRIFTEDIKNCASVSVLRPNIKFHVLDSDTMKEMKMEVETEREGGKEGRRDGEVGRREQ